MCPSAARSRSAPRAAALARATRSSWVLRAVGGERYTVDLALARPERGRAAERFVFVLAYREREVTLAVRDGFVTDEFVDPARTEQRTPEHETRLTALKAEMAERVMAAPAHAVYLAE